MADTKISALPASTTPLAGTEVLPIVQSGVTKQVSVANLTAGRAISATQLTLTTGNLIVASGQGIDFSATPGAPGATSELLADYEEGTWTPVLLGSTTAGTGTYSFQIGTYRKVGNLVYITMFMSWSAHTGAGDGIISGLPFTSSTFNTISIRPNSYALTATSIMTGFFGSGDTSIGLEQYPLGGGGLTLAPLDVSASLAISASYGV